MYNITIKVSTLFVFVLFLTIGCSSQKNNPISSFEPEVINNADAFQFQITDATNVSTTLTYQWENTGAQATVDHSTALLTGSATVEVRDADSVQVYSSNLLASGTDASLSGTSGTWFVKVVFSDFDGTVNFTIEKL
ncbi:MAG: hypothetical protein ABIJ12_09105 [bacterium]